MQGAEDEEVDGTPEDQLTEGGAGEDSAGGAEESQSAPGESSEVQDSSAESSGQSEKVLAPPAPDEIRNESRAG